jgi:hypothetical protein
MTVEKKRNLIKREDNIASVDHDSVTLQDLTDLIINISEDTHIIEIQNNLAAGARINSNILALKRLLNMFQYRVNLVRKEMKGEAIPRPANNNTFIIEYNKMKKAAAAAKKAK